MVREMETTPLGQHANENNSGPAIARRPQRECCAVSPFRHCTNFIKVTNCCVKKIIVTVCHPQYSTYLNNNFEVKCMQHCTYIHTLWNLCCQHKYHRQLLFLCPKLQTLCDIFCEKKKEQKKCIMIVIKIKRYIIKISSDTAN